MSVARTSVFQALLATIVLLSLVGGVAVSERVRPHIWALLVFAVFVVVGAWARVVRERGSR